MMVLLRFDVLQHNIDLARAYRKSAIPALPEKSAIPAVDILDLLRRCFLYLFDHLRLGESSRQRCQNVHVIAHATDAQNIAAKIAADRGQIRVHSRANVRIEPWLTILCAKNNVNDDFAEGLRHGARP